MRFRADIEAEKAAAARQTSTYNIKAALWSWVDSLVDYGVRRAYEIYEILNYSWRDVRNVAISAASASYDLMNDRIDDVKDYARNKANKAYNDAVKKINNVSNEVTSVRNSLNSNVNSLNSRINSLSSAVGSIDIPGASTVKGWLSSDLANIRNTAESYTNGVRNEMLTALSKADSIAGAARAKLIRDLEAVVKKVERDALAAQKVIQSNLDSAIKTLDNSSKLARALLEKSLNNAIKGLDNSSKVARIVLEKTLNNSLNILEREAKEAREVIEGTLIQIIEAVEDALEKALTDLERTFRGLLDVVIDRVGVLESWVSNAAKWFDTEINKYHDRVVDWIVDAFEDILDRVFR